MAPSHTESGGSRNHQTNSSPTPSSPPSKIPRPAYHTQTTANTATSHSSTKQTATVVTSHISKHGKTTAEDHKGESSARIRIAANAYDHNKPTSNATTQGVITVHLNKRLGRRPAIQCSPQDTIKTLLVVRKVFSSRDICGEIDIHFKVRKPSICGIYLKQNCGRKFPERSFEPVNASFFTNFIASSIHRPTLLSRFP